MSTEGIGNVVRLRDGLLDGFIGTYWAWPVDGYFDLHFVIKGEPTYPDGSDIVEELLPTLKAARDKARSLHNDESFEARLMKL